MDCEHFSYEEPFPEDVSVLFLLNKNSLFVFCFFFLKNVRDDSPQGMFAQIKKKM